MLPTELRVRIFNAVGDAYDLQYCEGVSSSWREIPTQHHGKQRKHVKVLGFPLTPVVEPSKAAAPPLPTHFESMLSAVTISPHVLHMCNELYTHFTRTHPPSHFHTLARPSSILIAFVAVLAK